MPNSFVRPTGGPRKRTLVDLLRELGANPSAVRPAFSTSPLAGPGRFRGRTGPKPKQEQSELERRRRLAEQALKNLGR